MEDNKIIPKNNRALKLIRILVKNFFEHNIGKNAAALAYYLLFALFPMLIFIFSLPGILSIDVLYVTQSLNRFLPGDVVNIIETYLEYVAQNHNSTLMWFALVFSIWFPMRAVKGLMVDVRRAYGLGNPKNIIKYTVRQLIYTIVFLVVIVLTLLLSTFGEQVLIYVSELLLKNEDYYRYVIGIWQYLRFIPVGLLMCTAIGTLYAYSTDKKQSFKNILPGIAVALVSWLALSIGFSFYVENFADYSVIYGTLGAVIVLMVWLYMTAMILILGAEFNVALQITREEELRDEIF